MESVWKTGFTAILLKTFKLLGWLYSHLKSSNIVVLQLVVIFGQQIELKFCANQKFKNNLFQTSKTREVKERFFGTNFLYKKHGFQDLILHKS